MKTFQKYFNGIIALLFITAGVIASVHFIRAYERITIQRPAVSVTIPEGATIYDIDRLLAGNNVLVRGAFVAAIASYSNASVSLEGTLFPDTYEFYLNANATSVIQKFLTNFNAKAAPLFAGNSKEQNLIIASMVQKEVASSTDMAIVAGILEKRFAAGMFLNVDATICYAKQMAAYVKNPSSTAGCYPITAADLKLDSPYNTYLHKGLPPTPIGNPGAEAIQATLHPQSSPFWYYLSDPKTEVTIYATTLAEQVQNQKKYLR